MKVHVTPGLVFEGEPDGRVRISTFVGHIDQVVDVRHLAQALRQAMTVEPQLLNDVRETFAP